MPRSAASTVTPAPDLALGKQAVRFLGREPRILPAMAVDGDGSTRWSSGQWMQTRAPAGSTSTWAPTYHVREVRLNWETAYAVDYQIQLSSDALTGRPSRPSRQPGKGFVALAGLAGTGRYVRIDCTGTSPDSNVLSLSDLQVFGARGRSGLSVRPGRRQPQPASGRHPTPARRTRTRCPVSELPAPTVTVTVAPAAPVETPPAPPANGLASRGSRAGTITIASPVRSVIPGRTGPPGIIPERMTRHPLPRMDESHIATSIHGSLGETAK